MNTKNFMNTKFKKDIENNLGKEIINDYAIFDVPYHFNTGDLLIYEGEINFLSKLKLKCVYRCSRQSCRYPILDRNIVILFHGGGNLGDIYPEHMEFLKRLCDNYPHNKIIVFPQTIYYANSKNRISDLISLSKHENLLICVRDQVSLEIIESNPLLRALLLTDMAFYVSDEIIGTRLKGSPIERNLYLCRKDIESMSSEKNIHKTKWTINSFDISDWPNLLYYPDILILKFISFLKLWKSQDNSGNSLKLYEGYFDHFVRRRVIKESVRFMNQYEIVLTDRLHGAILALLLDKEVIMADNSYHKNRSFFDIWLQDLEKISFLE